jgi:16S rRNA (uracil1498-N3)-methyltransferase
MGLCVRAVVVACARKGVEVKAEEYFSTENDLLPIEIACPVIKGERMDWAVAKAAELGVAIIHPVYTEYCVVKQDEGKDARRLARWRILCREALKQSRGNFMTAVSEPGRLEDFVSSRGDDGAAIVMWEGEGSVDMRAAWREQDNRLPLVLFVGPEGGFSKKEIEMFRQRGYSTASCGARILRSETAVISAVSLFSQLV